MAIRLKEANLAFFEIIKTGSTFIRESLEEIGIEYFEMELFSYFYPHEDTYDKTIIYHEYDFLRHSPWWGYKYVDQKFCSIRHPLSWYESLWKFYSKQNMKIRNGYINIGFFKSIPMESDFNIFIDRCIKEYPSMFTRIVEQFTGPSFDIVKVIKLENINNDLFNILNRLGYPKRQINPILHMQKINKSPNLDFTWEEKQKEKIINLEKKIIDNFYNEK